MSHNTNHAAPRSPEKALLITRLLDLTDDEHAEVLRRVREEGIL